MYLICFHHILCLCACVSVCVCVYMHTSMDFYIFQLIFIPVENHNLQIADFVLLSNIIFKEQNELLFILVIICSSTQGEISCTACRG